MRKTLVLAVLLIYMVTGAVAIDAELKVVDRTASPEKPATFVLEVQNNFNEPKTFKISSLLSPAPDSWFFYPYAKHVPAGENTAFNITVTPGENSIQQNYNFVLNLRASGVKDPKKFESYVSVNTLYDLNIVSTSINSNSFRPGEKASASITVLNTAGSSISDYSVKAFLSGEVFSQQGSSLESGSKATYNYNFQIPQNATPGQLSLKTVVSRNGKPGQSVTRTVQILEVVNAEYSRKIDDRILTRSGTLTAKNAGNTKTSVLLNKTVPSYMEPFTSFTDKPSHVNTADNGNTYYWNRTLAAGESASVSYRVRYWPPLVLLGFVLMGLLAIKRIHRDIKFSKTVEDTKDGIKVHIQLENSSSHDLENIEVTDFVPDIANVKDEFPMARPVIRKTGDGTRLTWEIDQMKPGEQRVFEYHITPMFEVEGGVVLPEAEIDSEDFRRAKTGKKEVEFKPKQ